MVEITVKFMSIIRQRAGTGRIQMITSSSKLRTILKEIVGEYCIKEMMLTDTGEIKPWARVLVNGRSQDFVGGSDIEVHDGDALALIYPYADNF